MYRNIGIVLGSPSVDGKGLPVKNNYWTEFDKNQVGALQEAISLCEDISGAGYFPGVLYSYADYSSWPQSLKDLKAIVVPELATLDKAHIQKLRDYVRDGGILISFAHSTMLNEKGERLADQALWDLYGVQNKYGGESKGGIIIFDPEIRNNFQDNVFELRSILNPVHDKSLKIVACLDGDDKQPVIFENKNGQGRSVYIAAGEAEFRGVPSFWEGILSSYGIPRSFNCNMLSASGSVLSPSLQTVTGMWQKNLSRYYVVFKESPEGKVLHIIDRKGERSDVKITIDESVTGKVSSASKIESGTPVVLDNKLSSVSFSVTCDPVASILFK
jgi:hypothetical protein